MPVDLSRFRPTYRHQRGTLAQVLWFCGGLPLLRCAVLPGSAWRRGLLRLFGASVGDGVVIKPGVRVKYPWLLRVGAHAWLGEDCWIDNLAPVTIGSNACVSQGAYLCTGNHDWRDEAFGLRLGPITIADGAWVGARAVVCPGAVVAEDAIATTGSVVRGHIPAGQIVTGNPATFTRWRWPRTEFHLPLHPRSSRTGGSQPGTAAHHNRSTRASAPQP